MRGRLIVRGLNFLVLMSTMLATPAVAQFERPSLADSFRLGSGGGVLCQVQVKSRDAAIGGIFDRAWSIVCRDAARPIGKLYALRGDQAAAFQRLSEARKGEATCTSETTETVDDLAQVNVRSCMLKNAAVSYTVLSVTKGNILWVAEGLGGYDGALKLGLRTVIADRAVAGEIKVATTSVDDPAAFARVQAGSLDPDKALAEGYRRNNSGNYAEAAEFFDTLQLRAEGADSERVGEYIINRALQKSNLGEFAEADALFTDANKIPTPDRVQSRLRRNFEAMHFLNQQKYAAALDRLNQPVVAIPPSIKMPGSAIEIGMQVAAEINSGLPVNQRLGASESTALTPDERATFLDAQAMQLRGTLLRLSGKAAEGRALLEQASADVLKVRGGRVISVIRLRSQILAETALAYESEGNKSAAEATMRASLLLLETRYPQTVAVNGARARLASLLARIGKTPEAMAEYKIVVETAAGNRSATTGLGNLLSPYFGILSQQMAGNPALVNDMFLASQTLVRPGVADTQAILARELSEGTGDAARLFRQARTLDRDVERSRIELATLISLTQQTATTMAAAETLKSDLDRLSAEQIATQAQLSAFPQYRAIASGAMPLSDLQASLRSGEAYLKITEVGRALYGIFVDAEGATGYEISLSGVELEQAVDALRASISLDEGGQVTTYPYDMAAARKLYVDLLGPAATRALKARHLIFEPDGAMLRLPVNLLVTDDASVERYQARQATAGADEFDVSGTQWLGRGRAISTVVAAKAFRDARNTPASTATRQYLGFGQNAPVSNAVRIAATRGLNSAGGIDCNWPSSQWNRPIAATELNLAQSIIGAGSSSVVTDAAFTDSDINTRTDLADYRILHFATHGLVTAPKPECAARPALLTSFGGSGSDGLLTFREIYDLKLNADLIILSACDTAGKATIAATREAGVTTGGGSAMDGLVRAFIGAGGRSVLASHWPAPDDFKATERLISGLFQAQSGASVGEAMASAQSSLMDDPLTSHPYYWSGFAIVGDSAQKMLTSK
jgi:CHAT domain-containing protein